MPGWLGKHPKHKLFMIQSSLLESQTWGRLKIKDIKPRALNCVRHPFNLALSLFHLVPPGQHWVGAAASLLCFPSTLGLSPSSWLNHSHEIYFPLCISFQVFPVQGMRQSWRCFLGSSQDCVLTLELPELESQSLLPVRDEMKAFNLLINFWAQIAKAQRMFHKVKRQFFGLGIFQVLVPWNLQIRSGRIDWPLLEQTFNFINEGWIFMRTPMSVIAGLCPTQKLSKGLRRTKAKPALSRQKGWSFLCSRTCSISSSGALSLCWKRLLLSAAWGHLGNVFIGMD